MPSSKDNRQLRPQHSQRSPEPRPPTPPSPIFHPSLPAHLLVPPPRIMPLTRSIESIGEDDEDRRPASKQGFFDDTGCVAEIDEDEEWDTSEQQNYRPPQPTRKVRLTGAMSGVVSYLNEARTKVPGNYYVEQMKNAAGRLVGFDAGDPGIPTWHPIAPRGMREEIPVIADELKGIQDPHNLPHSRIPRPLPGLPAGRPERGRFIPPIQSKLEVIRKDMADDRKKWLKNQEKERKNQERAEEYRELQRNGGQQKRQNISPDEDEGWTTEEIRGVPNPHLRHPPKAPVPTEARPGKFTEYARRGKSVNTFRPEQGLDITAINSQFQRGTLPTIGNRDEFNPIRDYWARDDRKARRDSSASDD